MFDATKPIVYPCRVAYERDNMTISGIQTSVEHMQADFDETADDDRGVEHAVPEADVPEEVAEADLGPRHVEFADTAYNLFF